MASLVKAAIVQTAWTGDKESMIDLHEQHMQQAAAQGAQWAFYRDRRPDSYERTAER